jgi:type I restriction enzyme S subunit
MTKSGTIPVYGGNGITGFHDHYNVKEQTLIIGRVGFYCGSTHITQQNSWVTDNALIVSLLINEISIHWLKYLIDSLELRNRSSSTAQPLISGKLLYSIIIALPPIVEQCRIVTRIEKTFPYIEVFASNQS